MTARSSEKRVMLLVTHLPDGGINTHMLTLSLALKGLGWDVAMCSGGPTVDGVPSEPADLASTNGFPPLAEHYERAGITHFEVSVPDKPTRLRELPRLAKVPLVLWQVMRAVRRFRPAVVHTHSRQMGTYARIVEALMGPPFVSTMHNPFPPTSRLFARTTFLGSAALGVSEEIREILIAGYGVPPERAKVVLPGTDEDHFRPPTPEERQQARERYGLRANQFALASIASIIPRKRPDTLVDAVADLVASGHDVVALLAGRGSLEEAVEVRAAGLGIGERVRLLGYQDARDMLWASDALVLPSESEGFGLVVAEAMLCGVAVLRTPAAGADQLIPDVTGVIFPHGDHEELARRVGRLIDYPAERESLVAHALTDARERFTSTVMARSVEEIYLEVIAERR